MSTILKTVEEIKQVFPIRGEAQIIFDLDKAQKDFINETQYLNKSSSLSGLTSDFAWALPSDFVEFKSLLVYNSSGEPLRLIDYYLDYEISGGYIVFKSTNSTVITSIPVGIATIYLSYYYRPATLTAITSSFSVEDEHIDGLKARVLESYYATIPVDTFNYRTGEIVKLRDLNSAGYWKGKAKEYEIKAKKYIIGKNNIGFKGAINYGMAGSFLLPLSSEITGGGTISSQLLSALYSKYLLFTSVAGVVTVSSSSFGWSSTPTVAYLANVFTITSANSEFTDTMLADSNNRNFNITSWAVGSAEITYGDASGTLTFWIAERV